jgi:hypothetical protein
MNIHDIPLIKHTESGNFPYYERPCAIEGRNGNADTEKISGYY